MNIDVNGLVGKQVEQRTADLGRKLRSTSENLRTIADQLERDQLASGAAALARSGAETVEGLGTYLETSDLQTMLEDAERFARTRPLATAAAGLFAGLLASRTLKATAARRYDREVPRAT